MRPRNPVSSNVEKEIGLLDARLERAGLLRAGRRKNAGRPPSLREARANEFFAPEADTPRIETAGNGVSLLAAPGLRKLKWLWHGLSTRKGGLSRVYAEDGAEGDLNLGFTSADDAAVVVANRKLFAEAVTGSAETPVATIRQIHSNIVVRVGAARLGTGSDGEKPKKADGLMTDEPGLLLAVMTADCIPVLVVDRKTRAVAAFHAGWRGTVKRIVEAGIGRMRLEFGSRPEDLVAAIGPGIGQCCYAVGDEVLAEFESQFEYGRELFVEVDETDPVRARFVTMFLNQRAPGHGPKEVRLHLDLVEANRRQLLAVGLKPGSIEVAGGCTSCQPKLYFSHRASGGHAGRMMSAIGIALGKSHRTR